MTEWLKVALQAAPLVLAAIGRVEQLWGSGEVQGNGAEKLQTALGLIRQLLASDSTVPPAERTALPPRLLDDPVAQVALQQVINGLVTLSNRATRGPMASSTSVDAGSLTTSTNAVLEELRANLAQRAKDAGV